MKGHVRERGRGNWYAVIEIRDAITGKRKRKWHSLPGMRREAQSATGMRPVGSPRCRAAPTSSRTR